MYFVGTFCRTQTLKLKGVVVDQSFILGDVKGIIVGTFLKLKNTLELTARSPF